MDEQEEYEERVKALEKSIREIKEIYNENVESFLEQVQEKLDLFQKDMILKVPDRDETIKRFEALEQKIGTEDPAGSARQTVKPFKELKKGIIAHSLKEEPPITVPIPEVEIKTPQELQIIFDKSLIKKILADLDLWDKYLDDKRRDGRLNKTQLVMFMHGAIQSDREKWKAMLK